MSAIRTFALFCDVDQCMNQANRTVPGGTAADTRRANAEIGWHRCGDKDVCPDCWDAGWRYGRDGWTVG